MSGSVESFDGLCGIIATFACSDLQIRCTYDFGHGGSCSFEKHRHHFNVMGCTSRGVDHERGFIDSVLSHQKK